MRPADSGQRPAGDVIALLATLPVKGRAPKTGYSRADFGPAWSDDVTVDGGRNGCDTRNDMLRRDLVDVVVDPGSHGCVVLSGVLHDPYTGRTIDFTRGQGTSGAVQIDHVVALLDAWQTGAQQLSAAQRENLANDPLNLQAVDGPTNRAKGAGDAATWLPPNKSYRCTYVTRQVEVKSRYHLWVTPAERDAILRLLRGCGSVGQSAAVVPASPAAPSGVSSSVSARTSHSSSSESDPAGCHPLSNGGNCYRVGEMCAARFRGSEGTDAAGNRIACRYDGEAWRWQPR